MGEKKRTIPELVSEALTKKSEIDLSEEQQNLLRLCRLLVDIQQRHQAAKKENLISEQAKQRLASQ